MKNILLALVSVCVLYANAQVNTTLLDTSYNHVGYKIKTDTAHLELTCSDVNNNGELIGVYAYNATHENFLFKYNKYGQPDTSFLNNGLIHIPESDFTQFFSVPVQLLRADKILITNDGKFLIVWNLTNKTTSTYKRKMVVCRYNANGSIDTTFAHQGYYAAGYDGGCKCNVGENVIVQNDGKIVLLSSLIDVTNLGPTFSSSVVIRLSPDGLPDSTFNSIGYKTLFGIYTNFLLLQQDQTIVIPYLRFIQQNYHYLSALKISTDGDSLSSNDIVTVDPSIHPATEFSQADIDIYDRITISGTVFNFAQQDSLIFIRVNPDISLDLSFGGTGIKYFSSPYYSVAKSSLDCDSIGNLYASTMSYHQGVDSLGVSHSEFYILFLKYNNLGVLDNSFGNNGLYVLSTPNLYTYYANKTQHSVYLVNQNTRLIKVDEASLADSTFTTSTQTFVATKILNDKVALGIIDNPTIAQSVLAYPNPIQNGTLTLSYELTNKQDVSIDLYNLQGQLISRLLGKQPRAKGKNNEVLNLPQNLVSGQYIIKLTAGEYQQGIKIIVE